MMPVLLITLAMWGQSYAAPAGPPPKSIAAAEAGRFVSFNLR